MTPIVELITQWDEFSKDLPQASVRDFCNYYLQKQSVAEPPISEKPENKTPNSQIAELIGGVSSIQGTYSKMVMKEMRGVEVEWFYILNIVYLKKNAKKTEVINLSLMEQSTGIDTLNRMKKRGLIYEEDAPNDKRAKLISLTDQGRELMIEMGRNLYKASYLVCSGIREENKQPVIDTLSQIILKHSKIIIENKNKLIDDIIIGLLGENSLDNIAIEFDVLMKLKTQISENVCQENMDDFIKSFQK